MAYLNISDSLENYEEKDPLIDIVYDIVSYIKSNNYEKALELLKEKKISFTDIINRTQRLKVEELVKFSDYVISHK